MKTQHLLHKTLKAGIFAAALFCSSSVFAQVKIGDNPTSINAGSALEIESTNKGLLMPRISLTNTTTWGLAGTAVAGMHIYNTNAGITSSNVSYPTLAAKIGEYYWDGTGWVALASVTKTTSISSFAQLTPGVTVNIPTSAGAVCGFALGSVVSSCMVDLNRNASFSISNPTNDVTIDMTGAYSLAGNNQQVTWNFVVAVDKTTPGVFEVVDNYFITHTGLGCTANYLNLKTALKNLPVRDYSVKVYFAPWTNPGTPAVIGVGKQSSAGICGNNDFPNQKVIVSVSQ